MSIYKLGELLESEPIYGANEKALKQGNFRYFRQTDIITGNPEFYVNKHHNKFMLYNDFFISRAGTIKSYYHNKKEKWVFAGYLVKYKFNKALVINKYIYYWSLGEGKNQINILKQEGSTMPKFNPPLAKKLVINLPDLKTQQKIIDIIEPKEKLFLQFPNCVRINSFENCKKDLQNLIDIIEPIIKIKNCLDIVIKKIKLILIKNYQINTNSRLSLKTLINIKVSKRTDQNIYFPTSAVGELKLLNEKAIFLENKIITRANLIPKKNSILFSKLKGENKVLPFFKGKKKWVFSTGFYNVTSNANDHMLGFLLSSYFQDQKNIYATGTTMKGLNNRDLFKIKIKKPLYFTNCFLALLEKQIFLINLLSKIQNQIIDLLIK